MSTGNNHVVLIGMMGVGKSTVGRLLAARLGWDFWDNDEALSATTGTTAAELQLASGADVLHATEGRLLREALSRTEPTVFAAAASVVLDPEALAGAVTVWLRASDDQDADQIARSGQQHRPLPEDAAPVLRRLIDSRRSMYERLADITVDVEGGPTGICDRVIEALAAREE
ncbi:MAG: hypothetical protein JO372_21835 [Solirubrobacterales bacterium]|nr:hypothetical protein [Solirubrobacterales bacterium]